jgi:transposase
MRLGLIGRVRRVWAPIGYKVVQPVEYIYAWSYLLLAVAPLSGRLYWRWLDNMKAVSIAPVLNDWHTQGVEVVVWDRARSHGGEAYATCAVARVPQPPCSPELNPAERIFQFLRSKVEGIVYGKLTAKQAAVEAELQALAAQPELVKQLASWGWIRSALSSPTS